MLAYIKTIMFGEGDSLHEISNAEKLEILQLIKEAGWEDAAALSKLTNLTTILEREGDYQSRLTSLASILSLKKEEPLPPPKYVTRLDLVLILLVLSLTTFLIALDNTIVATAIPKITGDFNSLSDAGWYGSAYLVTSCTLTLLYGRLYTFFSIKKVYLLAVALFEVGSLICGVAPNSMALIIGRAIAGLGGAGIFSGSTIILAHSVPMERRAPLQGLLGAAFSVASAAGPLIGGALADKLTWRWSFYINLPIGFFAVVIIYLYFQDPTANRNGNGTTFFAQLQKCDLV